MRVVRYGALAATPFIAVTASENHGWTRFLIGVAFVIVFGTYLVRALRDEPSSEETR